MKNVKLKTSINQINKDFEALINRCEEIANIDIYTDAQLTQHKSDEEEWKADVEKVINENFNDSEGLIYHGFEFAYEHFIGVYFSGTKESVEDRIRYFKNSLHDRRRYLNSILKLLPALDNVIGDSAIRNAKDYSIEDVFYLILSKLLMLKDGDYYSIHWILEGNAIELSRMDEFREIITELEKLGYIKTGRKNDAQITVKGELQLEKWKRARNRSVKKEAKSSIDDVMKELEKLGLGQEILF